MNWLYVFIGGGMGSMLRYSFSQVAQKLNWTNALMPTLGANVLGCFAIGILAAYLNQSTVSSPQIRWLWVIGFCGGFTTFSSFALEIFNGFKQGFTVEMLGYLMITNVLCLTAVWLGFRVVGE